MEIPSAVFSFNNLKSCGNIDIAVQILATMPTIVTESIKFYYPAETGEFLAKDVYH